MYESIFEGNRFDSDITTASLTAEDDEESICISETDDATLEDTSSQGAFLELLSRMGRMLPDSDADEDVDDRDMDDRDMDSDDYHNKAVDFACLGRKQEAAEICIEGLKRFPLNVDLLSDTIKYSAEVGHMQIAAEYYSILKTNVPRHRWNWRAFTFSFDYLLKEDPVANEEECRNIVKYYKKYFPYEEKARMAESELEEALGNGEASMSVLKEALRTYANASQCALRLADMQMDRGLFKEVLTTTSYGIAASAKPQPSINIPYLYYIRTLAKDNLLHMKEFSGEPVSRDEVEAMKEEYELLLREFSGELTRYAHMINMRMKMLKFVKAE